MRVDGGCIFHVDKISMAQKERGALSVRDMLISTAPLLKRSALHLGEEASETAIRVPPRRYRFIPRWFTDRSLPVATAADCDSV